MLALMAGRNAGEGVTLVKEGKVSRSVSTEPNRNNRQTRPSLSGRTSTLPRSSLSGPN
jgi:hypothetical protein